jgi:ketosteroid isomerase-like protein
MSLGNHRGRTIGGDEVTEQKAVVEKYTDGFRTGDLAKILSCLTGDVVWALHGDKTLAGSDAFAAEADGGDPVDFVYSEVFTFSDGLITRLDTFHIWLGEVPAA